ncbi:MAG: hypothetical protein FWG74_02965 [Planctomycetes bacterium]|nr:hypothetical protein [Planctomycetota bacterium]
MINLVERRLLTIKPQEAAKMIAEHNAYTNQRPLRDGHVRYLARKMEENRFFQEAQIAFARLPDGSSTILNGQHSLRGCVRSGVPIDASIRVFECGGEADLLILYSEMDQGLRRSLADVIRAGRSIMPPSLQDLPIGVLGQYGAAILMASRDDRPAAYQSRAIFPQNRVAAVCANPEEALFLHHYNGLMLLNRIPIRMAMVASFRAGGDRARIFWDGVADPDRIPANDPRSRLNHELIGKRKISTSAVKVRELYSRCLDHWNAHATGSEVAPYDGNRQPVAMKPSAPIPLLATVSPMPSKVIPANQAKPGSWPMTVLSNVPDKPAVTTA